MPQQRKIQSLPEMTLDMEKKKQGNRLYKAQSDAHKAGMLGDDIARKSDMLKAAFERGRVDLSNIDEVKAQMFRYLEACQQSGIYPTVMALAASYGISRARLNKFMVEHPNSESTRFLEVTKDIFADVLSNAALFRNASEAVTIFILKNCAGFSDRIEIEPVIPNEQTADSVQLAEAARMLPDANEEYI